jgi:uncharacterized protein (TIGR00730 family)
MLNEKELTIEMINENIEGHIQDITKEFKNGFEFIKKYPRSVTFFGSSRLTQESSHYCDAKKLASEIVHKLNYAVITGGGPGIMEAANCGAIEAKGKSVGLNIIIPSEQHTNDYTNDNVVFDYFFTRKTMLTFAAEAYIFFPGGFGTLDELFGILTLIQTKKIPRVPIVLFGKDYWNPMKKFLQETVLDQHHAIDAEDLNLFVITDSIEKTVDLISKAPISGWWKMMD